MKVWPVITCLLLLAACASGGTAPIADGGSFIATDVAPDAARDNPVTGRTAQIEPLTRSERESVALTLHRLDMTQELEARDVLLRELIELGPRYLEYFRSIDNDSLALDMMFVIRRIEAEHGITEAGVTEAAQPREVVNGDGPRISEIEPAYGEFRRDEVERFLTVRLQQARRLIEAGRPDQARRIAEAAIVLMPDSDQRGEFDQIILQARGELQSNLLIAGTMTLDAGDLQYARQQKGAPFAKPLMIHCYLKNVSAAPITLRLYEGEGKESLLTLSVTYDQLDYLGNNMTQKGNVSLPISAGRSIQLQPDESYSISVPLEGLSSLDADAPLKNALGVIHIEASLRVYGALDADGRSMVLRPVRFSARTTRVFPAEYKLRDNAAQPLRALRAALDEGWPQELFMAAHLIGPRDRRAAGDALVAAEYDDSVLAMKRARLRAMSVMFGTGANWDIERWRTWWQDNRLRH